MSQENVELLREGFEDFARGDMDAVRDSMSFALSRLPTRTSGMPSW
jgi:hypothetical protein